MHQLIIRRLQAVASLGEGTLDKLMVMVMVMVTAAEC